MCIFFNENSAVQRNSRDQTKKGSIQANISTDSDSETWTVHQPGLGVHGSQATILLVPRLRVIPAASQSAIVFIVYPQPQCV